MCRHLAYVGAPIAAADPALRATHSLAVQSEAAREMHNGCENLDGWGFGWFEVTGHPVRYRTAEPLTSDDAGRRELESVQTGRFLMHVRQKSPGAATDTTGNAPFTDGRWLFSHNGAIDGFWDGARDELVAHLSDQRRALIEGDTDSEVLFALVLDQLDLGATPIEAVGTIGPIAEKFGGRYNLVLMDDTTLVATRWANSLHLHVSDGNTTVASEPVDDAPGWGPINDRSITLLDESGLTTEAW